MFSSLHNPSFDPYAMKAAAIEIAMLDEDEYRSQLERAGYGERAIEKELSALREYKATLLPEPEPVAEKPIEQPGEEDPWSRASSKKRKERKVRFRKPIIDDFDDEDEDEDDDE